MAVLPTAHLLGSIPSPSFNVLHLGPLTIRLYGLCIATGVVAAVMIASKRWERRGGNPDDIGTIAIWAVPAGVIGARMYHVATDWDRYWGAHGAGWVQALNITKGGLGIPGGVLAGTLVGLLVVRSKKLPALTLMDVCAPAIPVAQALGRLGNWFNQELFGRPTGLPWGLRIDDPAQSISPKSPYFGSPGPFHPTFLYEALWNLSLAGLLIWLDRKRKLHPGELFTLYVLGYAIGRLWVEELRIDPASLLLGVRVNIWMSVITGGTAAVVFARNRLRPKPAAPDGDDLLVSGDGATAGTDDENGPAAPEPVAAARGAADEGSGPVRPRQARQPSRPVERTRTESEPPD